LLLIDKSRVMCVGVMKDLKTKTEGSTRLTYTWLRRGLEHLQIETRLNNEILCDCECVCPGYFVCY
jgi:hypothetical protein